MKVVLVGDTQVGKTCVLERLTSGMFKASNPATVGAAFKSHVMQTSHGSVSMQIWDTAGQEKFRALAPMYYRSASVAILFFDLTSQTSFQTMEHWYNELLEKGPPGMQIIVVGNKSDLVDSRSIKREDAEQFVSKHLVAFYTETSAKSGEGIIELFQRVAEFDNTENKPRPATRISPNAAKEEKSGCC